jgi:acyl carrier protein
MSPPAPENRYHRAVHDNTCASRREAATGDGALLRRVRTRQTREQSIMSDTLEQLRALIKEKFDIDASKIDPNASVLESGLDSLALTELLFTVEEKFGVELLEAAREVTSLAGLAALVDQLRSGARPASSTQSNAMPMR